MYDLTSPIYMLRDPDMIKKLAIKDDNAGGDSLFGNSLFAMRGQKWRDMRATLSPAHHRKPDADDLRAGNQVWPIDGHVFQGGGAVGEEAGVRDEEHLPAVRKRFDRDGGVWD